MKNTIKNIGKKLLEAAKNNKAAAVGLATVTAGLTETEINAKTDTIKKTPGKVHLASFSVPVSLHTNNNVVSIKKRAGGLGVGVDATFVENDPKRGTWFGISDNKIDHNKNGTEVDLERQNQENQELSPSGCEYVYLPKEIKDKLYFDSSNKILWPLSHGLKDEIPKEASLGGYIEANELFAEGIIASIKEKNNGEVPTNDAIWVHDYHLLAVPKYLKDLAPDLTVGFFYHIPFPELSPGDFENITEGGQMKTILENLLEADFLQFHTHEDVKNLLKTLTNYGIADNEQIEEISRKVSVNPIGIPKESVTKSFAENLGKNSPFEPLGITFEDNFGTTIDPNELRDSLHHMVEKNAQNWARDDMGNIKPTVKGELTFKEDKIHIASVSRFDYTKGIPELLDGYKAFLDEKKSDGQKNPGEKYQLNLVATAPRDIQAYIDYADVSFKKIDALLKEYPGSIIYIPGIPNNELSLFNGIIDVSAATSVKDGYLISIGEAFVARDTAIKMNALPIENRPSAVIVSSEAGISRQLENGIPIPALSIVKVTADDIKNALLVQVNFIEKTRKLPIKQQDSLSKFDQIANKVTSTRDFGEKAISKFSEVQNNLKRTNSNKDLSKEVKSERKTVNKTPNNNSQKR
jgi:trehalose-6-phosphate synthase